ncbi:O-antigen translocase [Shewanella sp. SM101]|uniref:O-antigen translocase n=1 Tax=Shewanella sp. SM101 TaxID=2912789 RepID=UPI0021D8373B|nr:O-antigen translocase [Shewanella sp. SM101]MCU8104643.1 O-antigen translocase [Shewanella sp. SM101]
MMLEENSKTKILKNSAIIGGASFLTILIGLIKVKVLAVLLGPAGIGLMGILITIMAVGSTFFGMGLSTSGVREIALNNKCNETLDLVRKALFSANCIFGLLAIIIIIVFKETLSVLFFQSPDYQLAITVIAIGVFFTLISGSQTALLQGLRRIRELAEVRVFSALAATVIGLLAVWRFGESSVPFFIITVPLVTSVVAYYYCRKLPKITNESNSLKQLSVQWRSMFNLGLAFMLTGLMAVSSQLIVRFIISQELNIEAVGYFQASWQISMTYITFVLGAMAADYYPRLTENIHNRNEANRLVNEQTEIAIIFAAPVLLAMLAFAPLVINLLYSSEFNASIEILRWQVSGDVLKVISWPLGFIMGAQGRSKLFVFTELLWNISYIFFVYFGIDRYGIEITGYAFTASYFLYIFVVYFISQKINNFKWTINNIKSIVILIVASIILLISSYLSYLSTMILGVFFVVGSAIYAVNMIATLDINNQKITKIFNVYRKCARFFGFKFSNIK